MSWRVKDHTVDNHAPRGFGTPAAYTVSDAHHVVYQGYAVGQGGDRHLHELYWVPGGGGWKLNELTVAAGGPPVLQTSSPSAYGFVNTQHVLYEGNGALADGQVHELYWKPGSGWQHSILTSAAAGATAALGVAVGFAVAWEPSDGSSIPSGDTQNVVYRDHNSHITALTWLDGKWRPVDLTVHAGGTDTVFDAGGYAFSPARTKQVLYIGNDAFSGRQLAGHVHEFLGDADGRWRDVDLHAIVAASGEAVPLAVSNPTGYAFANQQTKHVNFVGADGQIHEFWWGFDTGWRHNVLTGRPLSGGAAPPPTAGLPVTGFVAEAAMTQHLVYATADGSLHELLWDGQQGWQHQNLATPPTSAPPAFLGGTSAYVYLANGSQHVYYFDSEHHLIELWRD